MDLLVISYILYPLLVNNQMEQEIIKRFIKYWIKLRRERELIEIYKYREWCEHQDDAYAYEFEDEKMPNRVSDLW